MRGERKELADEVGTVRLHSGVACSHERRQLRSTAGVEEADVVGKGVNRQHSRVEKSDSGGDSC